MLQRGCTKINGKALKAEIYNKGYNYTKLERELDLPMYLGNRVRDGWLENWLIKMLESEKGIDPKKYVIIETSVKEPKEEPKAAPETITVNVDNVSIDTKAIETALINVLTNEEVRKQITQIIYFAVNKAIRNNP